MNILVTGGAGFIGSHLLVDALVKGGHQVTILDNLEPMVLKEREQNMGRGSGDAATERVCPVSKGTLEKTAITFFSMLNDIGLCCFPNRGPAKSRG